MRHFDKHLASEANTISFFGYPGAGKETVSKPLLKQLEEAGVKTQLLEVGNIVRTHVRKQTQFGQYVKGLEKGALVPDDRIVPVIEQYVAEMDPNALWFFDGFPRSVEQVAAYLNIIERYRRHDVMINLKLHDDFWMQHGMSDERMRRRGEEAMAAYEAAVVAGEKVEKPRDDDGDLAARQKRLKEAAELYDVADIFDDRSRLIVVDASKSKKEVMEEIRSLFALRLKLTGAHVRGDEYMNVISA